MMERISGVGKALTVVASLLCPVAAGAQGTTDQWRFSVMPYLWLPSLDGTFRYGPPAAGGATPNVTVDADTLLGALDFAFMVQAEARKGRWFAVTDLMTLDLSGDTSHVKSVDFNAGQGPVNVANASLNLGTESDFKGTIWTLAGGYSVVHEPHATFNILAGFRYLDAEVTTNWRLSATVAGPAGTAPFATVGGITRSENVLDGIVGVSGRFRLGSGNWFAPYHLDVGAGDSKLTWQAMAGIGYSFKWGDALLAYRYLSYEMGGNKLIEDLKLGGLGLGLNFRF